MPEHRCLHWGPTWATWRGPSAGGVEFRQPRLAGLTVADAVSCAFLLPFLVFCFFFLFLFLFWLRHMARGILVS